MNRTIVFITRPLLLCMLVLCLSCSGSSRQLDYFPLQKGYKWHYDVSLITRDGLEKQKYILNNLGQRILDNVPVFLRQSLDGTNLYYAIENDTIQFLGTDAGKVPGGKFIESQQIVMPYPPVLDADWQSMTQTRLLKKIGPPQKTEFRIVANVPIDATIESITETVSVPAGVFTNCLKITQSGSMMKDAGNYVGLTLIDVEETSWYAPGVGLVKVVREETTQSDALDRGSLLVELVEYEAG